MRQYLAKILAESGTLSVQDIILHILAAALLSFAIYLSYWYTHTGTAYSKKFNVTIVTLTVVTTTVMIVIGNNLAMSLGMVGALSIVRFRTAVKDSRDTEYTPSEMWITSILSRKTMTSAVKNSGQERIRDEI